MKNKIIQSVPTLVVLAVIGFSYFNQWCVRVGHACYRTIFDQIISGVTYPLYFFSLYFLPVALILLFVSREVFKSWLRLFVWILPLAFIFVATTSNIPAAPVDFFPFYRDDAARLAGGVFAALSLALIIWKSVVAHRK